ncbi:MAG: hypothetical protein BWK76_25705 [Desulfobulbaceae bacterium A2]|nr:MAG: hypothetical protein BWK76_25705 [Desulfobulbaceae bacterium A2]
MAAAIEGLVAGPGAQVVAGPPPREPLRAVLPSLALGGAERIVIEWFAAELRRGRAVELAVLHRRSREYAVPAGVTLIRRGQEVVESFIEMLAERWRDAASPVSAHLVADDLLARLWARGVRTVPVLHNTREGWRNDPARWSAECVPLAIACSEAVCEQAMQAGCRVQLAVVRHRPILGAAAADPASRLRIRQEWGIAPDALLVGVVGAFKAQKDHARAVEVLADLCGRRKACLAIVGGTLDRSGLAQLDCVMRRAVALGVGGALRLPGFVSPIEPWYAAFDALLNMSRHEGLSLATQEALAAGLPVVATAVGGQAEITHPNLYLLPATAAVADFAMQLAGFPVRQAPVCEAAPRFPRLWSVAAGLRRCAGAGLDTLFVTANLNAGGAQRSLVNLVLSLARRHRLAIAVCGETTHPAFPVRLAREQIPCFRPATTADPFEAAEGILARATAAGARTLCCWNVDPRVKLLLGRFAPTALQLIDVSPGPYAWQEMAAVGDLGEAMAFGPADFWQRLDLLVTKFADPAPPPCRRVVVIPNGVDLRAPALTPPARVRFFVSGRIAPSKHLERILAALRIAAGRMPDLSLEIVGQAEARYHAYLQAVLAAAQGLPVAFRGACPTLEFLAEPWTAAIVLGTHQGCPNAVLEAMSAGLAVIANDSGGTRDLVASGRTGWLLPEDCTAEELAAAMLSAAADPAQARRLGAAARELVARDFSLEQMAARYLAVLEQLRRRSAEAAVSLTRVGKTQELRHKVFSPLPN